jgi:hypothetical protein
MYNIISTQEATARKLEQYVRINKCPPLTRLVHSPFLNVTTSEKKIGFLLIEIFRRQNNGHQDLFLGGFSYMSGLVIIVRLGESEASKSI